MSVDKARSIDCYPAWVSARREQAAFPGNWCAHDLFRQAAVLDALPAHIALLDGEGRIITVNRAWRDFADANDLQSANYGIGSNYLGVLNDAAAAEPSVSLITDGIRAVLAGERASYSVEYPCHSSTEKRWFELTAKGLCDEAWQGAVLMHHNITDRKVAEEAQRQSLARLALATESGHIGTFEWDVAEDRLEWDAQMFALYGVSSDMLVDGAWLHGLHPDDRAAVDEATRAAVSGEQKFDVEFRVILPSGEIRNIEAHASVQRTVDGQAKRLIGVSWDITAHKAAQLRIQRQNTAHQMLSGISSLIVRGQNRDQLFADACKLVVHGNVFQMVMISVLSPETGRLTPVAAEGADDVLMENLLATMRAPLDPQSATAQAISARKPRVAENLRSEACLRRGRRQADHGMRSMAVFPLVAADQLLGVMSFYSSAQDAFTPEEVELFATLADDLAFAADHLEKQARLDYVAYHDTLTGLPNRRMFLEHSSECIRRVSAGHHGLAVCLFDIDRFNEVNSSIGLTAGDALLRQVGRYLSEALGDHTLVARVGSAKFAFISTNSGDSAAAAETLAGLLAGFNKQSFLLNEDDFRVSARLGVAQFPGDGDDAEALFRNAEAALSHAKAGEERLVHYTTGMSASLIGRLTIERRLRDAFSRGEFLLHYQPKIDLTTGTVTGAEALIRWQDPLRELVPPMHFIPVLEETGLIHEVGRWALHQALSDAQRWRARGLPSLRVAVNISAVQMRRHDFFDEMKSLLAANPGAAQCLELEITESAIVKDARQCLNCLIALRAAGVTIAIDDFGTGYSSLSYLSKLPVDTLKIDRSFVIEMTTGPQGLALVSTVLNLAQALRLKVVAEGVETKEQANLLRLLGCQEIQGFLVSKGMSADDFESRYVANAVALLHAVI